MRNPFKVGDKVVYKNGDSPHGVPMEVTRVVGREIWTNNCDWPGAPWSAGDLRVAIAGQDYMISNGPLEYNPNTGHLPDGSGVQKHSAGPLYPCVIAMRDGRLGGKYDYGVLSPRNQEPLWLSNHEAAVQLAVIIKEDLS